MAREYKPTFFEVRKKTRTEARQKQIRKEEESNVKCITTCNLAEHNINKINKKSIYFQHR